MTLKWLLNVSKTSCHAHLNILWNLRIINVLLLLLLLLLLSSLLLLLLLLSSSLRSMCHFYKSLSEAVKHNFCWFFTLLSWRFAQNIHRQNRR